tara:strand:- start:712 stop:1236 length:525 start_codon:yes stop_codon:yes gene_type:complete
MTTSNSNVIIAGIINTTTGELTRTLSTQKGKTENRLFVRDVLNKEHGDYAFMTFEFRSWDTRLDFIQRHMKDKDPVFMHELHVLRCRYRLAETKTEIERKKEEIKIAEEAADECTSIYSTVPRALFKASQAKREFIDDSLDGDIQELKSELSSIMGNLGGHTRTLKKLLGTTKA